MTEDAASRRSSVPRRLSRSFAKPSSLSAPLVLVHGLGTSHRYFARLVRELAPLETVAPDLRRGVPYDVPGLATALAARLDALGVGPTPLVANSLGCQISVELAVREPARVAALVLIGPSWDPAAPSLAAQARRLLLDTVSEPPSLLPVVARDYATFGPVRLVRTTEGMLADDVAAKLPRVGVPALVIRGSRDAFASQAWCERVAALLPGARLEVVRGGTHATQWSHPAEVARLVRRFVGR